MRVGFREHRIVSDLNHELFEAAREIMEAAELRGGVRHIGWAGVGDFIDWMEKNYYITEKQMGSAGATARPDSEPSREGG